MTTNISIMPKKNKNNCQFTNFMGVFIAMTKSYISMSMRGTNGHLIQLKYAYYLNDINRIYNTT